MTKKQRQPYDTQLFRKKITKIIHFEDNEANLQKIIIFAKESNRHKTNTTT